jgi:hypothetical protein
MRQGFVCDFGRFCCRDFESSFGPSQGRSPFIPNYPFQSTWIPDMGPSRYIVSPAPNISSPLTVKMDSTNSASISQMRCYNLISFVIHSRTQSAITNAWSKILSVYLLYQLWTMELVSNSCEVLSKVNDSRGSPVVFSGSSTRPVRRTSPVKMVNNAMTNSSRTLRPNSRSMPLSSPNVISLESTTMRGLHHMMLPISSRRIRIYLIQHSFLYCAILPTHLFQNFSLDLVWQRSGIARTIKLLFKLKFHLDLYITLHLSFVRTTLYLQCRMNIPV